MPVRDNYLLPGSNNVSSAKVKVCLIPRNDFGNMTIETGHTVHLLDLCVTSNNISIFLFCKTARVIIVFIAPPTASGDSGHGRRGTQNIIIVGSHFYYNRPQGNRARTRRHIAGELVQTKSALRATESVLRAA